MSDHSLSNITADALREAADIRDQIESLQARLEAILTGSAVPAAGSKKRAGRPKGSGRGPGRKPGAKKKAAKRKGGKRKISAEGLERIRAAQKARWAKAKKGK